jgi:hypothetical protein
VLVTFVLVFGKSSDNKLKCTFCFTNARGWFLQLFGAISVKNESLVVFFCDLSISNLLCHSSNRKMVAADVGRGEYFRDVFTDWLSLVVRICEKCRIESVHLGD